QRPWSERPYSERPWSEWPWSEWPWSRRHGLTPAAHAAAEVRAEMADGRIPMNLASRRRLLVLYAVAAAMLISLGGRLWYLQVMKQQQKCPGVTAQVQPVIQYPKPAGANPAQVLGYLQPITPEEIRSRHLPVTGFSGVDLVGQAGLEAQYDGQLRGKAGTQVVSVNAAGDVTGTVSQTAPANGDDLVTSLNAQIQAVAQNALDGAIARSRASGNAANQGAAVVMTTTGRVVAMASYPDYDPSVWTGGISQRQFNALFGKSGGQPIINWTTQGQYAPGSTFKVTSTAAAVADGYPLYGLYGCPGSVTIAGHTFGND